MAKVREDSTTIPEEDVIEESVLDTLTLSEMRAGWVTERDSMLVLFCSTRGLCRISPYDKIVKRYARRWGFDWRLISAQIFVESGFREKARSRVGALGLMQIMPSTAKWLGVDPSALLRPEDATTIVSFMIAGGTGRSRTGSRLRSRATTPGPRGCAGRREGRRIRIHGRASAGISPGRRGSMSRGYSASMRSTR